MIKYEHTKIEKVCHTAVITIKNILTRNIYTKGPGQLMPHMLKVTHNKHLCIIFKISKTAKTKAKHIFYLVDMTCLTEHISDDTVKLPACT